MDKHEVRGNELYRAEWPSEKLELNGIYPTAERAQQEKADLEATEAIYDASGGGRNAWHELLRMTFPEAKLCNCRDALYGCKYGCEWNQGRTKEAVAIELLKRLKR